jgi:hypothetical protein
MAPALARRTTSTSRGRVFLAAEWIGLTIALLPWAWSRTASRAGRALASGTASGGLVMCSIALVDLMGSRPARCSRSARVRGRASSPRAAEPSCSGSGPASAVWRSASGRPRFRSEA